MVVVEITGKANAGKSTLARQLSKKLSDLGFSSAFLSFALPLKTYLRNYLGVQKGTKPLKHYLNFFEFLAELQKTLQEFLVKSETYIDLDVINKLINELREDLLIGYECYFNFKQYKQGFRKLAQLIGTDIIRKIDESFFVRQIVRQIFNLKNSVDYVFIDDFRFPNEDLEIVANFTKDVFKVYKIRISSDVEETHNHISEILIDDLNVNLEVVRKGNKYSPDLNEIVGILAKLNLRR